MFKNRSGQKIAVFAWDKALNVPKPGDAANITAQISKDFGAAAATNDVNPAELDAADHPGIYIFDLAQAETDADHILWSPVSATANIQLEPVQAEPEDLSLKGVVAFGTAQSASAGGAVLAVGEAMADDIAIGMTLALYGQTQGYWQARVVTDNALSGDAFSIAPDWTQTPSGAPILYRLYASAPGATLADFADAVADQVETRALILDAAYDAAKTAATQTSVNTVDTVVDAVKAKTDSLTFTVANTLDANMQRINDVAITGDGSATPFNV